MGASIHATQFNSMTTDLLKLFDRELSSGIDEVLAFPTDELLWTVTEGVTNSAGNLALHLAGNLQHFIGHVLGGTGYVRDREAEFGSRGRSRAEVVGELESARETLAHVLPTLTSADLATRYPGLPQDIELTTQLFLMHLSTHAAFHVGQIGYLRRIMTGENRSTGSLSYRGLLVG
jgi:uncharacterized damage-inducible protein DinB